MITISKKKILFGLIIILIMISGCQFAKKKSEETTLRIMAAASLTEVFNDLEKNFEEKHPDIELGCNYAGSQTLFSQIKSGVPADIFASANVEYMERLENDDLVIEPTIFTHNKLVIVVSEESEKSIDNIDDLIKSEVKIVIANESVPVGKYTLKMLDRQSDNPNLPLDYKEQILAAVVSKELDVKSVITKVELGEADAGIVYKTDANAADQDKIKVVNIKNEYNVTATYLVSLLQNISSKNKEAANKFLDYLYSDDGQKILEKQGFIEASR
jgi:molybdate transport system substrate-binding protein